MATGGTMKYKREARARGRALRRYAVATAGAVLVAALIGSATVDGVAAAPPAEGPGGPILVVTSSADGFGAYLPEILRTEGLAAFAVTDLSNLTAATLAGHQIVILGPTALSAAQVSILSTWVAGGGKLIAMRPDAKLAPLLGLTPTGSTLSDGYLGIDTTSAPGAGITAATMQFHGTADRYTPLAGTRTVATLYSTATAATPSPAVTLRSVGGVGGEVAAFAYDLGRSVVYTHQGNPAWAGQERDGEVDQGTTTIRSDDLFFGGATAPDYVDLNKVAVPQADEQQRLLANLITDMESDRLPVPRLWYFPNGHRAAIVMTGDQHANGEAGTTVALDRFIGQSPPGCSVVDWACVRATSYVYTKGEPTLSAEEAKAYEDAGFEIALHLKIPGAGDCNNYPSYQHVKDALDQQLDGVGSTAGFLWVYRALQDPATIRTHCIVWSDWDSQVRADLSRGIRLNTDYYYWPSSWVAGRSGMFTGAGIPMRFAATNGSVYDVFQATTQLPDESFPTAAGMGAAVATLLDGALGPNGYYGFFTANAHNDSADLADRQIADTIVGAAQSRGVPVISARQLLTWLDGRDGSSFQNLSFAAGHLRFTMVVGAGAHGLQAMLPVHGPNGDLQSVSRLGQAVPFTVRTIKGVDYAVVSATAGDYDAAYATDIDTTPPVLSLPADKVVDATDAAGTTVTYVATATDDVDASPTVACAPPSGSLFPVGASTVGCTATDSSGNSATGSFTVTVVVPNPGGGGGGGGGVGGGGGGGGVGGGASGGDPKPADPVTVPANTPVAPAVPTPTARPLRPVIGVAKLVPRPLAGRKVIVSFRVTRSDNRAPLRSGRMTIAPSIAGKVIKHSERFRDGVASLSFTIPKNARGKLLKVELTIRAAGQASSKVATFRVRRRA